MPTLKQGSSGPDVTKLQQRLKDLGFDPKGIDGNFGRGTEAAVIKFQQANGLVADGKVGPKTRAALQLDDASVASGGAIAGAAAGTSGATAGTATATSPLPNVTVAMVSKMFPGTKVSNIEKHLPIVLQALVDAGLGDKNMV